MIFPYFIESNALLEWYLAYFYLLFPIFYAFNVTQNQDCSN